jgi:ABC-type uncharacterized transport system permease subunit
MTGDQGHNVGGKEEQRAVDQRPQEHGGGAQRGAGPQAAWRGWRVEKRLNSSVAWQTASILLALLAALAVSSLLIASAKANVPDALRAMVRGAFGSRSALLETLVQATPFVFTGLAVTVAFRARAWNIGAEGQFFAGAMAAYWVSTRLPNLPPPALFALMLVGAWIAGGVWGGIPGFLKARWGVNEIIVTVMMNFIIAFVLSYLLSTLWQDPKQYFYQTALMPETSYFPKLLAKSRLHLGFVIALVTALLVYILLWKTTLGYEIRAIGINPLASRYKGINVARTTVLVMAISGAIAAMAGVSEVAGIHHRLRLDISIGYGFTGIIIALLGRLHPAGVILAAIFFGALVNGALGMQIETGVPVALVNAIQGITMIFLLTADVLSRYQIGRVGARV